MTLSVSDSENHLHLLDRLCQEEDYVTHPVMLVNSNGDHKNWNRTVGPSRTASTLCLPMAKSWETLCGFGTTPLQKRSMVEGGEEEEGQVLCFQKLFWYPHARSEAREIQINKRHKHDCCHLSMLMAFALHLKELCTPTLPNPPPNPRVVWEGQDTNNDANLSPGQKHQIIHNQGDVVRYLRNKMMQMGCEFFVTKFYGDKMNTAYQEQAQLVSRTNVMIGVHSAGLNLFFFLPFNSVIIKVHLSGTCLERNSANTVNHIEGKYFSINCTKDRH